MSKNEKLALDKTAYGNIGSNQDFPLDEEDQERRFLNMMIQLQKENKMTLEEEEKMFGRQGYFFTGDFGQETKKQAREMTTAEQKQVQRTKAEEQDRITPMKMEERDDLQQMSEKEENNSSHMDREFVADSRQKAAEEMQGGADVGGLGQGTAKMQSSVSDGAAGQKIAKMQGSASENAIVQDVAKMPGSASENATGQDDEDRQRRYANGGRKRKRRSVGGGWGRKLAKCAAFVLIVTGSIFCVSMTSEANRTYVMDTVEYVIGDDVRTKVRGEGNILEKKSTEAEARADIEEQLGVKVPVLSYYPIGMRFDSYLILDDMKTVYITYMYNDQNIVLAISQGNDEKLGSLTFEGTPEKELYISQGTAQVQIYKSINENGDMPTLEAKWQYKDGNYLLGGNMEDEEFEKMVRNLYF